MHALEFFVNGSRVCVVAPGDGGVVVSHVVLASAGSATSDPSEVRLRVGGIRDEQHLEWLSRSLAIGDVVEIRIVDAPHSDPPATVEPVTDDQRERLQAASKSTNPE
jgi:hypothetical protein